MPNRRTLVLFLCVGLLALVGLHSPTYAWDSAGHKVVAQIASDDLDAGSRAAHQVQAILRADPRSGRGDFLWAAVWPDALKMNRSVRANSYNGMDVQGAPLDKPWHFVDIPYAYPASDVDTFIRMADKTVDVHDENSANVVTAIRYYVDFLKQGNGSGQEKADALSWLVHLVGDVHQPLHCVTVTEPVNGYPPAGVEDRGGNGFRLLGVKQRNLHAFWDDRMDPNGGGLTDEEVIDSAGALESAYPLEQDQPDDPLVWARESYAFRTFAYSTPEHQKPDTAYVSKASEIGKHRVATAGHRLAMLLNEIWP